MSNIHYFPRYSQRENTVTNNTLLLFARLYDHSPEDATNLLSDIIGDEEVRIGIEIAQQKKGKESIPDGVILQRGFKILIETKVNSDVETEQIANHAKSFSGDSRHILLLLTKQNLNQEQASKIKQKVKDVNSNVMFQNVTFEKICSSIEALSINYTGSMKALAADYIAYCNDEGLFDQSMYFMRIVPCSTSIELNKKYGIYFHPSDRGYTSHSYLGVYANKAVKGIWKIDSIFDVTLKNDVIEKSWVEGTNTDEYDNKLKEIIKESKKLYAYDIENNHRFFCGKVFETDYKKNTAGGIQGARFVNLKNVIEDFEKIKEDVGAIAERLKTQEWL